MRYLLLLLLINACGTDTADKNSSSTPTALASPLAEGKDGTDGKDGKDGTNGSNGKDGVNGTNAVDVEQNEWLDSVSTKKWTMGASSTQPQGALECTNAYRVPTIAELSDACFRGLFKVYVAKLGATPAATSWASTSGDVITIATCLASTQSTGVPSTIVCIQK